MIAHGYAPSTCYPFHATYIGIPPWLEVLWCVARWTIRTYLKFAHNWYSYFENLCYMVAPGQPKYTATEIKKVPVGGCSPSSASSVNLYRADWISSGWWRQAYFRTREKNLLVGLTFTVCYKRNGPPKGVLAPAKRVNGKRKSDSHLWELFDA